jgi:hypothetical protein
MSFQAWRRQLRPAERLAALGEGETPAQVAVKIGYRHSARRFGQYLASHRADRDEELKICMLKRQIGAQTAERGCSPFSALRRVSQIPSIQRPSKALPIEGEGSAWN